MSKAPAYQHYAQDWLVGTAHFTLEAQGAYQRLLDHQWVDGPLPDDHTVLRRMLGTSPAAFRRIWRQLEEKFPLLADGRRANERLEAERVKQAEYREKQAELGRKGADKRWHRGPHSDPTESGKGPHSSSSSSSPAQGTTSVGTSYQPGASPVRPVRARVVERPDA